MTKMIEIKNLMKKYGKNIVLKDITENVNKGQVICVIGPSGSGKSTLARLLEREADPDHGTITVGGISLQNFTDEARTRSLIVVPQEPALFAWTVRENLRLYRMDANDNEIVEAARAACIAHAGKIHGNSGKIAH